MIKTPKPVRANSLWRWGYSEGIQLGAVAGFVVGALFTLCIASVVLWGAR